VTNDFGAVTSSFATLTVIVPPSITTQPTNLTVLAGQNTTFIAAAPAPCVALPVVFHTNTALTGATNSSLTVSNVQTPNAGGYSLRVTNDAAASRA